MRLCSSRGWLFGLGSAVGAALIITALAILPALGTLGEGISSFTGTTVGAVASATNGGSGTGFEGITGATAGGQAIYGIANNASHAAFGVHGKVFGPSSTGLYGEAVNSDTTHPSIGLFGYSNSGNGIYAYNTTATAAAAFIKNVAAGNTAVGLQAQAGGNAVIGQSTLANGAVGQTSFHSLSPGTAQAGVMGVDTESTTGFNSGVVGMANNGLYGVYGIGDVSALAAVAGQGKSGSITGVRGISFAGNGVLGETSAGIASSGIAAIQGLDESSSGTSNFGVAGHSTSGIGVHGVSTSNAGVLGESTSGIGAGGASTSGIGVFAQSSTSYGVHGVSSTLVGVHGVSTSSVGVAGESTSGVGVEGVSISGNGVFAESAATPLPGPTNPGNINTAALAIKGDSGGPLIIARNSAGTDVMSLDDAGNLTTLDAVMAGGTPLVVTRTSAGVSVLTYAPQQSVPSVEDVGEGQLVGGHAYVRIDPVFAATMDPRSSYLVFITPQGPLQGTLYVTQKSRGGFAVVENQGGHSTVAFDYRIVARPFNSTARRLPLASTVHQLGRYWAGRPYAVPPHVRTIPATLWRAPQIRSLDLRWRMTPHYSIGRVPKTPALPPMVRQTTHR